VKSVLITGGTGFVGANLCRRLLDEGHEVFCLVRPDHNPWRIADIEDHLQIRIADLSDPAGLESAVSGIRPDWIFHLAAYGAYSWQTDVQRIISTNFLSTVNLIQACLKTGFEILVNTGSSSEYGFKDHAPAPKEWLDPNSYYAVGKAAATLFCRYTAVRHNACIPTLRLYSVYGPFEEPGRLIPSIIVQGLAGSLPPLVGPTVARDYIHVRDVEDAYLLLAKQPAGKGGEVYNVGTGIQTTLSDVVEMAVRAFNLNIEPQWGTMPNREWDTSIWKADNDSLVASGWQPRLDFEQGFKQTVSWFVNHPEFAGRYAGS
jgi:UDP-glucose 4-epimerase